jgi:hypothetical protein
MSDIVMTYFEAPLQKENNFLSVVAEFLPDLKMWLSEEGQSHDDLVAMIEASLFEAQEQARRLYQMLHYIINGVHQPLDPSIEQHLPHVGHPARQSALFLAGCESCIQLSPERHFFKVLGQKQIEHINILKNLLQKGQLTPEDIWNETQIVLQLDSTIPREQKDPKVEAAKFRKQALVVPMAFAAGRWLGDDGINFLREIVEDSGLII